MDDEGRDDYGFEEFINPNDIFHLYDEDFNSDQFGICSQKFIPIGISSIYSTGGGFMLGTKGGLKDKIILDTEDSDQAIRFVVLDEDIISFVSKFVIYDIKLNYIHQKDFNKDLLIKKWGEGYWGFAEL